MCCLRLFLSLFFFLIHPATLTVAQYCYNENGNYTSNSTYEENLKSVLASMSSNTEIDYGFYNFSSGETPDKVNAIALCRGDISPEECRSCVNATSHDLLKSCPNQKEAIMWPDKCMLRYSNRDIFGVMESWPRIAYYNTGNVSDVEGFNGVLRPLLKRLRNSAASGNSTRKFALGSDFAPNFQTLSALVECTPDLDQLGCNNCLLAAEGFIRDGKQGGKYVTPSCDLRYEIYGFYDPTAEAPPPSPVPPPSAPPVLSASPPPVLPSPPIQGKKSNSSPSAIVIVVPTVISAVLIICIGICYFYLRVRKEGKKVESEVEDEISSAESLQFDFGTIKVATENFSNANKLGQGGFGAVYKGRLPNGQEIAVKRLLKPSGQRNLEFKNEVVLVARLQHRNLVRLIGFCLEGNERLLIYEFMPNSSLDKFIFDPIKRTVLHWERRYKIIEGIARGILYLHEDSQLRIIHRDLKAGNILLDADMNPKISDFGTARLFMLDQTQGNTKKVMGTYGYMPPEYVIHGRFSVKSDVFSFGVLVLEIMSGTKISSFRKGEDEEGLLSYAWKNWREGTTSNLIDPTLRSSSTTEILRCIHIGLLCVQENVANRPTMASVLLMLNDDSIILSVPKKPAFLMDKSTISDMSARREQNTRAIRSDQSRSRFVEASANEASFTKPYPR
ncbi:cysteine-rich receptor-like protein kinase 44 isoform X2 [Alnus glutinosa]|uniref:cysteine-rich receptor-like protein kinase 44 isoform X2 n=1 Tax=Alnus glutinosa TaxID=3517 RepID=UPI002D77AD95|nr:cysteine-rich receptor-like protein kinase 44 isoform X2 [Alnus glutinosa]